MGKLKKNLSFFENAPDLVKEWHPTANGSLKPRQLEIVYPDKVWWICSEGHEWQATIEDRLNQTDCPNCTKNLALTTSDTHLSNLDLGRDFRKHKRHKTKGLAVVEIPGTGHWVYVELRNFSNKGLCFETDAAMRPGSKITIRFDEAQLSPWSDGLQLPSNTNGLKTYSSVIKWCKKLDDDQSISNFACGVKVF